MEYLRVRNWDKFQQYRNRNPPWIKFHTEILETPQIAALPDAEKAQLFGVWLLASKTGNRIPADADFISRRINSGKPFPIKKFVDLRFLEYQDASGLLAGCEQLAIPEERRGEENRGEREAIPPPPAAVAPAPKRFTPPTPDEVLAFFEAQGVTGNHHLRFLAYYTANGWKVGKNPVKRWKAAAAGWILRGRDSGEILA